MKNKKIFLIITIVLAILITILIIFKNNSAKNLKVGNNSSSQEIVDYILNLNSYEAEIEVEVNSNKTTNKYVIKQKYSSNGSSSQEIIEPKEIQGLRIEKENNKITLENSKLNLSTTYENYEYLSDNCMDLISFVENYKQNETSNYEEKNNQIIMKVKDSGENKKISNKILYIDKKTAEPTKMEVIDDNQNITICIIYKEVNVNS